MHQRTLHCILLSCGTDNYGLMKHEQTVSKLTGLHVIILQGSDAKHTPKATSDAGEEVEYP